MSTKKKEIKNDKTKTRFILQAQNPLAEELYATIKEQGFSVSTKSFSKTSAFSRSVFETPASNDKNATPLPMENFPSKGQFNLWRIGSFSKDYKNLPTF